MIFVLEGLDGCGKGTQAEILIKSLLKTDPTTGLVKFPDYTTPIGRLLQDWMHGMIGVCATDEAPIVPLPGQSALALQAILLANKTEQADLLWGYKTIGNLVVDRYWQSGVAYGAGVDGLDYDYMVRINRGLPAADINFLINIPVSVALERQALRGRKDIYEGRRDARDAMERCNTAYVQLWARMANRDPTAWVVVDGTRPRDEVAAMILAEVMAFKQARDPSWLADDSHPVSAI
jgi:dTMP kinase